jgi:hypothetical protein
VNNQQRGGATSGFDLNTDVQGSVETKWLFAEFDAPLIPFRHAGPAGCPAVLGHLQDLRPGVLRLRGCQHRHQVVAERHVPSDLCSDRGRAPRCEHGGAGLTGFNRGDDFAFIASVEITPFKGLDIRPIYSYAWFQGATSGAARATVSGGVHGRRDHVRLPPRRWLLPAAAQCGLVAATPGSPTNEEHRHTVGLDARWRSGPFSVEPTIFYQFGTRDTDNPFGASDPS